MRKQESAKEHVNSKQHFVDGADKRTYDLAPGRSKYAKMNIGKKFEIHTINILISTSKGRELGGLLRAHKHKKW